MQHSRTVSREEQEMAAIFDFFQAADPEEQPGLASLDFNDWLTI